MGISSTGQQTTPSQHSAAPASGKYGGFGNKDLEKMGGNIGYSNPTASNKVNAYDPYVNGATTNNTKVTAVVVSVEKKKKKKKKKNESSDEDSSEVPLHHRKKRVKRKRKNRLRRRYLYLLDLAYQAKPIGQYKEDLLPHLK